MAAKNIILIAALGLFCGTGATFGFQAISNYSLASFQIFAPLSKSAVSTPAILLIPSIGVRAPIMAVGVQKDGSLGVPADALHVAWYARGPKPGETGTAILDGHVETITTPEAVFYNLNKLQTGNEIDILDSSGQNHAFVVTGRKTYAYNASDTDLFETISGIPQLNLITCAGDWLTSKHVYNERLAVFAKLK